MIDKVLDKIFKKLDKSTLDKIEKICLCIIVFGKYFLIVYFVCFAFVFGVSFGFSLCFSNPDTFAGFELDFILQDMVRTLFIWSFVFSAVIGIFGCIINAIHSKWHKLR